MSFGGSEPPDPAPPPPVRIMPMIQAAKEDIREKLKRAQSRAASWQTPGFLEPAQTTRPALSDILG